MSNFTATYDQWPTEQVLKKKFPIPDEPGPALDLFRKTVAEIEGADERNVTWMLERFLGNIVEQIAQSENRVLRYMNLVAVFVDDAHRTERYSKAMQEQRDRIARLEREWVAIAALHNYFKHCQIQKSAAGLAEFMHGRYPEVYPKSGTHAPGLPPLPTPTVPKSGKVVKGAVVTIHSGNIQGGRGEVLYASASSVSIKLTEDCGIYRAGEKVNVAKHEVELVK